MDFLKIGKTALKSDQERFEIFELPGSPPPVVG